MEKTARNPKSTIKTHLIYIVSALVLFLGTLPATSMAKADVSVAVDVASAYVWRGLTFNDGAVIQPSVDVAAENGLGFNVWANYDVDDYNKTLDESEFSEVDLTASYGFTLGKVDMGVGVIAYLFPGAANGDAANTNELYLSAGFEIVDGLSAGITGYYDIDTFQEFAYANLGLAYGFDITEELSAEIGAAIGYAGDEFAKSYGGADGGLYDYTLSVSFGYTISDAWSVSAGAAYIDAVDDDNLIDGTTSGTLDANGVLSVGVSYSF